MAVPTITQIKATSGLTRGRQLVRIQGTNFQLPPTLPVRGKTQPLKPSVEVLFGSTPALRVDVLKSTLLHVLAPPHDPGTVSVTVRNIDQNGAVVGAETVTQAAAYTYARPNLAARNSDENVLALVIRALRREMARQIVDNVVLTTHVDFDDTPDGANIAALADIPGLVLSGPRLRENRLYSLNTPRRGASDLLGETQLAPGYTVDLVFTVIGVDELEQRLLGLMTETTMFFHRNICLRVLSPHDGQPVDFEMQIEGDGFDSNGGTNNSNVRSFTGTVVVRGVTIDDQDMAVRALRDVDELVFSGQQGTTLPAPNPPQPPLTPQDGLGGGGFLEQIPPDDE